MRKLNLGRFAARRLTAGIATVVAVIVMFAAVNAPAFIGASSAARELPIYCVKRDDKAVSLTFDAAWGNEDTQRLIDILGKYDVKATFFIVGEWVDKYPESVKALYDAGHEIGNHSNDHAHFNPLSPDEIARNITACNEKISAVTGAAPALFRAPYGEYDNEVIRSVKSLGMDTIQWDVDSLDWKGITASEIMKRVTDRVAPGSIVLFHNAAKYTPEALPAIIESLIRDGYSMVPVSELLLKGEYTLDHTGRQLPSEK